ncbi:alpha-mannosidase [Paenibacillus sacheonensis]|uniref:Glycoside hydrolase family 38 central domain-containing protein n=1 Tax=Paenibacillus sacheonensis TaxID=742054 RepID=A0A7X4YTF3_9BACL|nr:glycoside hydrolase family 38 C-terminal domain-containing protein [Paenibacillus sacheonensis]MBM7568477.1 hypothetical protein [Paenibacillus sacheonensis]NBC72175.1 hypothetical protein [Paenibacillus sacheonensis]
MAKQKVFVTPTTHWDREWVMTKGQFQVRWVRLVDNLLTIMAERPDYHFLLDGQAIVLEDYLTVRPEKRKQIESLLAEGRLIAGPWYVLADQFLENGESMIRNLLVGMAEVRRMGGRPMMLGYVPDSFGSLASLPMLLNGFGIRLATFGRGRPTWDESLSFYEFEWQGPAGSSVLAANHGYSHGIFLSYPDIWTDIGLPDSLNPDPAAMLETFMREAAGQGARAATGVLHFSVGIDHMEARASLPGLIDYLNANQDHYEIVYGTPEDYLNAVAGQAVVMQQYAGEMRGSSTSLMDLVGTLSSHMPLKQSNDTCEILLQRSLEPLWAMASWASGAEYPQGLIANLWRILLANHPHDSICGCSLDQVHLDMHNRYDEILHTGSYMIKDGLHALMPAIDTTCEDASAVALVIVNPAGRTHAGPVRQFVRVTRRFKHAAYELVDESGRVVSSRIRHVVDKNKDLESFYMTAQMLADVISKDAEDSREDSLVYTVLEVDFLAEAVPATGYRTYWIRPATSGGTGEGGALESAVFNAEPVLRVAGNGMENASLAVRLNADGTYDLTYKRTGRVYRGLNFYADREETGDLYDHHELATRDERDSRTCGSEWQLHEAYADRVVFKSKARWSLPRGMEGGARSAEERDATIETFVMLRADIERLEIEVAFDNECEDHMLRAVFETGIRSDRVHAYDHFNVVERQAGLPGPEWRDEPFQSFVDVSDGREGLCLTSQGLPAYEAEQGEGGVRLMLTLLRSAGSVGTAAGANYPAPGGQCKGSHRFSYALIPHEGDWRQGECMAKAEDYRTPLLAETDAQHGGRLPSSASLLVVTDARDASPFVSCLKQAEDGDGWIVRLWNDGEERAVTTNGAMAWTEARRVLLDESAADAKEADRDGFLVRESELLTLRIGAANE